MTLYYQIRCNLKHFVLAIDYFTQSLTNDVDLLYAEPLWQSIYEKRFKNKAKSEKLPVHTPVKVQNVGIISTSSMSPRENID
jgi:hypothetical protein